VNVLPPASELQRAFDRRDSTYDGVFYTAVKTTGIFCRPVCPARRPRPENVEFFATPREAMLAGYRPCLRCRPADTVRDRAPEVERLLRAIEADPSGRLRDADLRRMGIDPSTARRRFRRHFGMTFQAYHRARRLGGALAEVRSGAKVIESQLAAGFDSGSGFREAFARLFGAAPGRIAEERAPGRGAGRAAAKGCLVARWIDGPLGAMLALANDDGLHLLDFVDRRGLERELGRVARRFALVPGAHPLLDRAEEQLAAYFRGERGGFDLPLAPRGTPFQRGVWSELLRIPPGATRSYAEIAARLGMPKAVRAVARANGDNYRALVIPCHRVVGSDGSLTGYGGGLARKQWLLDHERRHAGGAPDPVTAAR